MNLTEMFFPMLPIIMNVYQHFENSGMCLPTNVTMMPRSYTEIYQPLDVTLIGPLCELHLYPVSLDCGNSCFTVEGIEEHEYEAAKDGPVWFRIFKNISAGFRTVIIKVKQASEPIYYEIPFRKKGLIRCSIYHEECTSREKIVQKCGKHGICCKLDTLFCSCEVGYSGPLCAEADLTFDSSHVKVEAKPNKDVSNPQSGNHKTSKVKTNPVAKNVFDFLYNNPVVTIISFIGWFSMISLILFGLFKYFKRGKRVSAEKVTPNAESIPLNRIQTI